MRNSRHKGRSTAFGFVLAMLLAPPLQAADERLPDADVTVFQTYRAWLTGPTASYGHAVLGDGIEAQGFTVEDGTRAFSYRLPADAVFEDRRVRLFDLDRDGRPEALIVKSYLDRGAALALFRIGASGIFELAESEPIGTRYRWLNPVGVGNFTSGGSPLIAAVITPHLAGSLRLYKLDGLRLQEVARLDGFTNHIIGSRDLDLAHIFVAGDSGRHEILIPSLDRLSLNVIGLSEGGILNVRTRFRFERPIVGVAKPQAGMVTVTLQDGQTRSISLR